MSFETSTSILITGATGLVGNNVVRLAIAQGYRVRVLVRKGCDQRPFEGLDVEQFVGDVVDSDSILKAVDGVDAVVHSAAVVHIGWSQLELQRRVNVQGTRNVAAAARSAGARMIHVSSVDALGIGAVDQPATEETPREGKTPCSYVITKREAEEAFHGEIEQGLDGVIVNPGFMLGPWDWKPSSGRMLVEVANRFAPVAPSGGMSLCDVRDVAAGILSAVSKGKSGENYILAGHNVTYLDAWRDFARVAGRRGPLMRMGPLIRWGAGRGGDLFGKLIGNESDVNSAAIAMSSLYHYYDSSKAQRELDYRIRPMGETIHDAWKWFSRGLSDRDE